MDLAKTDAVRRGRAIVRFVDAVLIPCAETVAAAASASLREAVLQNAWTDPARAKVVHQMASRMPRFFRSSGRRSIRTEVQITFIMKNGRRTRSGRALPLCIVATRTMATRRRVLI